MSDDDLPPGDMRVSCALVDASGDEVSADPKALGGVESGHTMVLDREKLLRVHRVPAHLSADPTHGLVSGVET